MEDHNPNLYLPLIARMLSTAFYVDADCILPDAAHLEKLDHGVLKLLYHPFDYKSFLTNPVFQNPEDHVIYFLRYPLERNCVILKLPGDLENRLFVIGPFLYEDPASDFYERVFSNNRIPSSAAAVVRTYLTTVPVISEMAILSAIHTITPYIFMNEESEEPEEIRYLDLNTSSTLEDEPVAMLNFSMEILEQRYKLENQLLEAVTKGDAASALAHLNAFGKSRLPPRVYDPVRDVKNLLISINTLYRKAAERGNVHPIYLDEVSTKFSLEIEHTNNLEQLQAMAAKMTRKYCLLVNNYSLASYSHSIRQVINYINLNLSSPLTLTILAGNMKLNPSYLSGQFKKETGATLTEYIHTMRIETAVQLLNSTTLPIREVAYRVGIDDFSYFTKLFRKYIHMSPTRYRSMLHEQP